MLNSVVLPAPLGPMIDEIPRSMAKSTSCSAVSPPNRLVTPRASNRFGTGRRSTPPRAVGATPVRSSMRELALASAGGEDALGAEDHHQDQNDPEYHALVLCRLELGREISEAVAEHRHARVLQLVEPEREPLEHL